MGGLVHLDVSVVTGSLELLHTLLLHAPPDFVKALLSSGALTSSLFQDSSSPLLPSLSQSKHWGLCLRASILPPSCIKISYCIRSQSIFKNLNEKIHEHLLIETLWLHLGLKFQ